MSEYDAALRLAKSRGFDSVRRIGDFRGMHAFFPERSGGPANTGLPAFIVIDNGIARGSTYEEIMARLDELSEQEDDDE